MKINGRRIWHQEGYKVAIRAKTVISTFSSIAPTALISIFSPSSLGRSAMCDSISPLVSRAPRGRQTSSKDGKELQWPVCPYYQPRWRAQLWPIHVCHCQCGGWNGMFGLFGHSKLCWKLFRELLVIPWVCPYPVHINDDPESIILDWITETALRIHPIFWQYTHINQYECMSIIPVGEMRSSMIYNLNIISMQIQSYIYSRECLTRSPSLFGLKYWFATTRGFLYSQ